MITFEGKLRKLSFSLMSVNLSIENNSTNNSTNCVII